MSKTTGSLPFCCLMSMPSSVLYSPLVQDTRELDSPMFQDTRELDSPLFQDTRELDSPLSVTPVSLTLQGVAFFLGTSYNKFCVVTNLPQEIFGGSIHPVWFRLLVCDGSDRANKITFFQGKVWNYLGRETFGGGGKNKE